MPIRYDAHLDRGELTSGRSGRHHGLLHSGARYAVGDCEAGVWGVLDDLDPTPKTRRRIGRGLWTLGTLTIAYGMALLITLAIRS